MSTLVNAPTKEPVGKLTSSNPNHSQNNYDGPWFTSASSSRRDSFVTSSGTPFSNSNMSCYDPPMPKLARAASVSFLPNQTFEPGNENLYLKQLSLATSQYQNLTNNRSYRNDLWSEERARTSSISGPLDSKPFHQQDYGSTYNDTYKPPRRMSLNPLFPHPPRSQAPSYGSGYPSFNNRPTLLENEVLGSEHSLGNRAFPSYSRRESVTSPLATHSGSSSDSLGASSTGSRFSRRFSLAPQFGVDWDYEDHLASQMDNLFSDSYSSLLGRRHSVAASAFPIRQDSPPTPAEIISPVKKNSPPENRFAESLPVMKPATITPKPTPANDNKKADNYFIIEFKGGRTDCYYIPPDSTMQVKNGDLVIVEADRGQDLGKVIRDDVGPVELVRIQKEQRAKVVDTPRFYEPKKIYRHAQPAEVSQLVNKCQDEAKALQLVTSKLRHHNLPMEIVEAEYQWDRRKLTFFYSAKDRIDFRELVRELFRVYKTRIWMCAVSK